VARGALAIGRVCCATHRSVRRTANRFALPARFSASERAKVVGYDVVWAHDGQTGTVRSLDKPGERLLVRDGVVLVSGAGASAPR
jgi:uncharacterized protein YcfJ